MRNDSGVRSTRAREVTISATYMPPPYSRQSLRKAELVIPAMGARITGVSTVMGPSFRGGSSSLGAGGVATTVTRSLSQSRANRRAVRFGAPERRSESGWSPRYSRSAAPLLPFRGPPCAPAAGNGFGPCFAPVVTGNAGTGRARPPDRAKPPPPLRARRCPRRRRASRADARKRCCPKHCRRFAGRWPV